MLTRKSVPKPCGKRPRSRNQNNRLLRLNSGTRPAVAFSNFWELKPPRSSAPDDPGSHVGGTTSSVWLDTNCLKNRHACPGTVLCPFCCLLFRSPLSPFRFENQQFQSLEAGEPVIKGDQPEAGALGKRGQIRIRPEVR